MWERPSEHSVSGVKPGSAYLDEGVSAAAEVHSNAQRRISRCRLADNEIGEDEQRWVEHEENILRGSMRVCTNMRVTTTTFD